MRRLPRSSARLGGLVTTILVAVSLGRALPSAGADVGGVPTPQLPIPIPGLPAVPTLPTLPPVTLPPLPVTTPTSTTTPAPNCKDFSISPLHPQWGQTVSLTPNGSFGADPGSVKVVGLSNAKPSAALPLHSGTGWNGSGLSVDLPSSPPNADLDQWTVEVVSNQVHCSLNIPTGALRILDCSRLAWGVQNAWRLHGAVNDMAGRVSDLGNFRTSPLPIGLGPADRVSLQYNRLLDSTNNQPVLTSLTDVLNQAGGAIQFAFTLADGRPEEFMPEGQFGYKDTNAPPDSQTANLNVLPRPSVVPADQSVADPAHPDRYVTANRTLNLDAMITLPAGFCQSDGRNAISVSVLSIEVDQAPMVLPSIGVFFVDANYGGDALAVVYTGDGAPAIPGMPLPAAGAKVDGKSNQGQLAATVNTVALALELLNGQVGVLQPNFPGGLPALNRDGGAVPLPAPGSLKLQADQLRAAQHPAVVAGASTYQLIDIKRDGNAFCCSDFAKQISSLAVVGYPQQAHFEAWRDDWFFGDHWVSQDYTVASGGLVTAVPYVGDSWNDKIEKLNIHT